MHNFALIMDTKEEYTHILAQLLMIDSCYTDYNCIVKCNEFTKKYIESFPIKINGNVVYICNTDYEKKITLLEAYCEKLDFWKTGIKMFGNIIFLTKRMYLLRKFDMPENLSNICFIKRHVEPRPGFEQEQYAFDYVLFMDNETTIDYIKNELIDKERELEEEISLEESEEKNEQDDEKEKNEQDIEKEKKLHDKKKYEKLKIFWAKIP